MTCAKRVSTFFFIAICSFSNAQDLLKIRPFSSVGDDYNWAASMDADSNLYMSFSMNPRLKDSININNQFFYDSLLSGSFLAKLDHNRNLIWMFETPYVMHQIEVSSTNNIIISGFRSNRFYVSMLSPSGDVIWEINESVSNIMVPYDMVRDESDNIFITGVVNNCEIFGLRLHDDDDVCGTDHDFLVKFNSFGEFQWVIASGPDQVGFGRDLTMDDDSNIYLLGEFIYSASFGGYSFGNSQGYENAYIATISSSGDVQQVFGLGGNNGHLSLSSIAWYSDNRMLFGGTFTGTVQLGDSTITSYGSSDIIYGSIAADGVINWFKHMGTSESENFNQLIVKGDKFLLTGHTESELQVDSFTINAGGTNDVSFILQSSVDGTLEWIKELSFSEPAKFVTRANPLNNRNFMLPLSETKTLIYGSFTPKIMGSTQSFDSRSQDLYTAILDENCTDSELTDNADLEFSLCPNEAIEINLSIPNEADSYSIDLLEGDVGLELSNDLLQVSEFKSQYARVRLQIENCRSEAFQEIILLKKQEPTAPEINGNVNWCASDIENASITAIGKNIRWYTSESLTEPIASGNQYKVTSSETLSVTQTVDGCESQPSTVAILVEESPIAPIISQDQYVTCLNSELIIDLSPNQYNWYDTNMSYIKTSSSINITPELTGGYNYYITSGTVCESLPTPISIEVLEYDLNDVFIPNVITPNGDDLNEYFSLNSFKSEYCLGQFQYIMIVNRNGTPIYKNMKRDFKWNATNETSGVYYYLIKFQHAEFNGSLTVFK